MLVKGVCLFLKYGQKLKDCIVEVVLIWLLCFFHFPCSTVLRSNSFISHDQLSVCGRGSSRFRLGVNMGSYCATEETNVSNCSLFINYFVSLLTCVNGQVGVKVRYCLYTYVYPFPLSLPYRGILCICMCISDALMPLFSNQSNIDTF